jgi:hypothetical protein
MSKHKNRYDETITDFCYVLNFDNYRMTIYKSGITPGYFLTEIEIDLDRYVTIKSLFPYQAFEQFKTDKIFRDCFGSTF